VIQSRTPWLVGWKAAKANALPAFILQAFMLAVMLGYFFHPPTAAALNALARYKHQHEYTFVVIASIIVGAVVPEIFAILFFQRGHFRRQNAWNFLFNAPFWALDGALVNVMYAALASWLGDRATVGVVTAKILVDQLGYNPFYAAPSEVWGYAWKNNGYSFRKLRPLLTWRYYKEHAFPVLVATWAVWVPLMAIIYSLPFALQFPLFAIALSFWVLMITYMTNSFAKNQQSPLIEIPVPQ